MIRQLPLALLLLFFALPPTLQAQWKSKSDAHRKRSETTSVVYEGKLYTFLGFADWGLRPEPSVEVYDPQADTWTLLADIPQGKAVTHQGVVLIDDDVWHIGGRVGQNPGPVTSEIWIYNITSNTWRQGPDILDPANGQPLPWAGGGAALLGRTLHVFGGFVNSACNSDQDRFHLTLDVDAWKAAPGQAAPWKNELQPMPVKRNHFATVVMGGKIYALGGQFGHDCGGGEEHRYAHVYDPATDRWTRLTDMHVPRSHIEGSTFALDGKIYIIAGQSYGGGNTDRVTVFDPEANDGLGAWWDEKKMKLANKYEGVSAKVIGEVLYVTHGGEGGSTRTRNTAFAHAIERNPRHQLGFTSTCATLDFRAGQKASEKTLLYTWDGAARYTLTADAPWLTVEGDASGTVQATGVALNLQINTAGLAPGTYKGQVTATANGFSSATYCVNLTVKESGARISAGSEVVFSGVQGAKNKPQPLEITNDGADELVISAMTFGGSNGSAFALSNPDILPLYIESGKSKTVGIEFTPGSGTIGALSGELLLESNAANGTQRVPLYGVSARGEQGNNEPPLDAIVKTLGYTIDVGGTGLILSTRPEAIGEEVLQPLFRKAGNGPVTMKAVARYSPDDLLSFGWYTRSNNQVQLQEVGIVATGQEQTLYPKLHAGGGSFDPGSAVFGFYTGATRYAARPNYTEDALNNGPLAHAARIYPLKDRAGKPVANSYLIAFEPASNGDYQDYVFVVSNITPGAYQNSGVLEAETAVLHGAAPSTNNKGYSGTGFADFRRPQGDYVEWTLERDAEGPVVLTIRYANGQAFVKPCRLEINGELVQEYIAFGSTGEWSNWQNINISANLQAGSNVIRLTNFSRVGPDVDYLAWQVGGAATKGILEAEEAALSGPIVSAIHSGHTGSGFADYQNPLDDFVEWNLSQDQTGKVELSFVYANGGRTSRPVQLMVNDKVVEEDLSFAPTGKWTDWKKETRTVSLVAGVNRIRLTAKGASGPNIDHLAWELKETTNRIAAKDATLGIDQPFSLSITPNPAVQNARLSVTTLSNQPIEVQVFDPSGRLRKAQWFKNDTQGVLDLPVGELPPGIYLVRVKQGNQVSAQRLVIGRK